MSIQGQGHSLTLAQGYSDMKIKTSGVGPSVHHYVCPGPQMGIYWVGIYCVFYIVCFVLSIKMKMRGSCWIFFQLLGTLHFLSMEI